ncbi:TonB-dependent receptor plug domain-containing protein [Chitinophaga barathri]|uniref:TonB-dependent receptor n=1 Tax=Chitinophaga barathri TaxID=1647451 RepID=A0A3N4MPW2_9BACT|nr:TonB-dependent receptor [Chitinophaga barathri]RPD41699.1 TonB-dependent receptor [Chitinophaga barathri]
MKRSLLLILFFIIYTGVQAQNPAVFRLGEVVVKGAEPDTFSTLNKTDMLRYQRLNVAKALDLIPGITIGNVGPRNESVLYIRGFNLRQVPVFVDGIPVYVPYDGYVDLARFTTYDISRITVSKGNASVLYGPNTMGGAINIVTVQPVHKLDLQAGGGWFSGGHDGFLNAGSRFGKFYAQAGLSVYKRNGYQLSDKFTPVKNEDGGNRDHVDAKDMKLSLKLGYRPNRRSEYALGYLDQQGEKGNPVYAGQDTLNSLFKNPRYWQWPYWNKRSAYFLANIQTDSAGYLKLRLYYDQFRNRLDSYDDGSYTRQTRPYAFSSLYNDHNIGANAEYRKALSGSNHLTASVHFKQDVHKEHNLGEPEREMADRTLAAGITDEHRLSARWTVKAGLGWNFREGIRAEDYNSQSKTISSFPHGRNDAWNVQAALLHYFSTARHLEASFGRMTRLATMKDRYSYRLGTAVPNPGLNAEDAQHYELKYDDAALGRFRLQAAVFLSRISNVIQRVNNVRYDTAAGRWLSQMQNKGRASFHGAEVSVNYRVTKGLNAGLNYAYISRRNLSEPQIRFTDVPDHRVTGTVIYALNALEVMLNGEYNTARYSTSYGVKTPGFFLLNASGVIPLHRWVKVIAGVNNLFDKNYSLVEGYPEQGRNYFVKLNIHYSRL